MHEIDQLVSNLTRQPSNTWGNWIVYLMHRLEIEGTVAPYTKDLLWVFEVEAAIDTRLRGDELDNYHWNGKLECPYEDGCRRVDCVVFGDLWRHCNLGGERE